MSDHNSPPDPSNPQATSKARPNLALPTFGGVQFWADWRWRDGWRIQENVLTAHHRVLDPKNRRQAWGSWPACLAEFERLAPSAPQTDRGHLVVLLHGMGRGRNAFVNMHAALERRGFDVAAISYPSTRRSIAEHVMQLETVLSHIEGYSQVSFVTHSLGGVVVRELLAPQRAKATQNPEHSPSSSPYWQTRLQPQRVVMIAPPNQGSAFAQRVESFAPFGWIFGDTGLSLTPKAMADVPIPQIPVLVVAGVRSGHRGWNPWLESPNDGVVSVAETHLPGEAGHLLVDNLHTFLMNDPATIEATADFLVGGSGLKNANIRRAHD